MRQYTATKNILLLFIFDNLFYFILDMALFTIYLTDYKELSIRSLGIFLSVFSITNLIFEVPAGIISDRFGRVLSLAFASILMVISNVGILFGTSFFILIFSGALAGISSAFKSGTVDSLLYDNLKSQNKEENYKKINTNLYASIMFSIALSMLIGGYLSKINMNYMYIGNIISMTLAFISCLFMVEPPNGTNSNSNNTLKIVKDAYISVKSNPRLIYLILFISITASISNDTWTISQKLLSNCGLSNISVTYEAIITTLLCGLSAKLGFLIEKRLKTLGFIIYISSVLTFPLIILGISSNVFVKLIALTFTTISISFASPVFSDYINKEVDSSYRTTLLSVQTFLSSILSIIYFSIIQITNSITNSFIITGVILIPSYILLIHRIKKV